MSFSPTPSPSPTATHRREPFYHRLRRLADPVRVCMTGAGSMGKGLFYQLHHTPGMACVAVADVDVEKAIDAVAYVGEPYAVVETLDALHDTIRAGKVAICADGDLVASCTEADVFVEATNAIAAGGRFCLTALAQDMHVVLMNAEIDLIFGPLLMQEARKRDLIVTSCDGDQHGVIKRLVDEVRLWGFDLVMAGNIKGYLDPYANPTSIIPEADKRNLDYHMCTAYTDGTKLSIEMALVANALNLRTDTPGMRGSRAAHVDDALSLFDLPALHANGPVVDYVLGAEPGGGVFVIGHQDDAYQRDMMQYYKMGEGPYYVFYRPYHLCHVEAMQCIAEAQLDHYALLEPTYGFQTNVYCYAKKDLQAGDTLDGIGGYACYGQIKNVTPEEDGLPICLAHDVTLTQPVAKDTPVRMQDVQLDDRRSDMELFQRAQAIPLLA